MTIQQMFLSTEYTPISLTFITSSGTTAATSAWTPPALAEVGDLEILFHFGWDNDSEFLDNADIPSGVGFQSVYTNTGSVSGSTANYLSVIVTRRVLTDKVAQTFVNPGLDGRGFVGMYWRPSKPIASYTLSTVNFQSITGNPTSQSVTASSGVAPLIVFGAASSDVGTGAFSTQTPAFDGTQSMTGIAPRGIVGWTTYNSSPADHTIDMNDLGSNMLMSFYLSVSG